jgi:hypothetical protein
MLSAVCSLTFSTVSSLRTLPDVPTAVEAGFPGGKAEARALIHGMPFAEWKAKYQSEATPEQLARMEESLKKNGGTH